MKTSMNTTMSIPILVRKEPKFFLFYCPVLDVWSFGKTAEEAERKLKEEVRQLLMKISKTVYVPPTCFAWIHLGLGNVDEAFTWIDRAIDARDPMIIPIKSYPFLDPLRTDQRFHALLRKMKLEE